jgi:hypothetical protein
MPGGQFVSSRVDDGRRHGAADISLASCTISFLVFRLAESRQPGLRRSLALCNSSSGQYDEVFIPLG